MFSIILVCPQLGENIGACARAMKNFGVHDLRIVRPRDGWPNEKAISASVGASDIIHNAKIFRSLEEGISDCEFIYATTGQNRDLNKLCVMSKDLKLSFPYDKKVGIMFGRENCGLNNNEISYANAILAINTNPEFTSLNIAQAVLTLCYELYESKSLDNNFKTNENATQEDLHHFYNHLFGQLEDRNFFKVPEKKEHMKRNIINIFARIPNLERKEVQILRGILNSFTIEK